MKIKMTVTGNKAIFSDFKKEVQKTMENEILRTTEAVADEARTNARRDLGFLVNSITDEVDGLEGLVRVRANYSPYVEFGTGALVDVPAGLEEYAIQFKGAGIKQVNLPPRPFLYPAWKTHTIRMMERLRKKYVGK